VIALPLIRAMGRVPVGASIRARKSVASHAVGGKLTAKKVGNKIKDAFEKVAKVLAKEGKTIAKRNNAELASLSRTALNAALDVASGDASKADLKEVLKDTARQTGYLATRDALTRRGIYDKENS
jgi:hypothetical protein